MSSGMSGMSESRKKDNFVSVGEHSQGYLAPVGNNSPLQPTPTALSALLNIVFIILRA
jgi:hypothetical protein